MKKIVIMGAGGFGSEAIWVLEEMNKICMASDPWEILGYVDDDMFKNGKTFYDYITLGSPEKVAERYRDQDLYYYCAIGKNAIRFSVSQRLDSLGWKAATLVHPSVIFARNVSIGEGTYIGAGSVVCPNATIGKHVIINTRVAVGHDSVLGDFSQACPGAQINGFCRIGNNAFIGSNASILPEKSVGENATVGANSQVVRSVKNGSTVNGVPAVIIR